MLGDAGVAAVPAAATVEHAPSERMAAANERSVFVGFIRGWLLWWYVRWKEGNLGRDFSTSWLSLRRSLSDCGNPRHESGWIAPVGQASLAMTGTESMVHRVCKIHVGQKCSGLGRLIGLEPPAWLASDPLRARGGPPRR